MKHAKTLATSLAVVVATSSAALAMNIGILQATSGSDVGDDGGGEWAAEPTVLAIEAGALPSNTPSASAAAAPAAERSAPAPSAAPATAAPTAAPSTAAPTTAPSTAAPTTAPSTVPESSTTAASQSAPSTTYHTYTVGSAGEVVIANHGSSLEFWAAYPAAGWEYAVEHATGKEIKVEFRGDGELEWKAKLEDGKIKIEMDDD